MFVHNVTDIDLSITNKKETHCQHCDILILHCMFFAILPEVVKFSISSRYVLVHDL